KLFDLAGRKALGLGAASGIGKASAEALGALGAEVYCADIDLAQADATAAAIRTAGGTAHASRADAASGSEIAALVTRVKTALGRIDIAVTTPGINIRKLILNYGEADFDRIVDLNIKGTFFFFREVGSAVAFLASDAASYISGSTLLIDAGWTAIDGPPTGLTQVG